MPFNKMPEAIHNAKLAIKLIGCLVDWFAGLPVN